MTRTLGIIGSGLMGSAVARLAVAAGMDVVVSNSREAGTLARLVADLGSRARAATPPEAARAADLVVAAVPLHAFPALPADALAGKTVVDTANYYPERDGAVAALDAGELTSTELLQRHLDRSRVVKAFNTVTPHQLVSLARASGARERSALPVAGDDPAAKAEVTALLDRLGYDAVDVGVLADSWRSEPNTPVYVLPYLGGMPTPPPADFLAWTYRTPGVAVPAPRVAELVGAATRRTPGEARIPRG